MSSARLASRCDEWRFRSCAFMRCRGRTSFLLVLSLALVLPRPVLASDDAAALGFGLISVRSPQRLKLMWGPLIDDLQRQTGLKVSLFFAANYEGIAEAMKQKKVHFGYVSQRAAIEAVDTAGAAVIVQTVSADGSRGYYSQLIVHQSSKINNLADLFAQASALTYGIGDPKSTSGYLVPEVYVFGKRNLRSKSVFAAVRQGNHETNALLVANQQVDVAANNNMSLAIFKNGFPDKFNDIRVIWQSPLIPNTPILVRKDLPRATIDKLKGFFLSYGRSDEAEKRVLAELELSGFVDAGNEILAPIRTLELYSQRNVVRDDPSIGADIKARKLEEIDRQVKPLD